MSNVNKPIIARKLKKPRVGNLRGKRTNEGQYAKAHSRPKPKLSAILEDNPFLASVVQRLDDGSDCSLAYPAMADADICRKVKAEILRQVLDLARGGELASLRLYHNVDPGWESAGDDGHVRLKVIGKCASAIKRTSPDAISLISIAPAPTYGVDPGWNFAVIVSTLELGFPQRNGERLARIQPVSLTSTVDHGPRPVIAPQEVINPSEEDARRLVAALMSMSQSWRRECQQAAREAKHSTWREQALERKIGTFAMQALMPVKKAFFASGKGSGILRVAFTAPLEKTHAIKKDPAALTRERVIRLLWEDAYSHNRPKPPFLEL